MAKKKKVPARITPDNVDALKSPSKKQVKEVKAEVGTPHACNFGGCDKSFKTRVGLASHFKSHMDDKPSDEGIAFAGQKKAEEKRESEEKVLYSNRRKLMIERLDKQQQIQCIIPLNQGEKEGVTVEDLKESTQKAYEGKLPDNPGLHEQQHLTSTE